VVKSRSFLAEIMDKARFNVYLSLGSNLGDRMGHLREAVAQLSMAGDVVRSSAIYETEAWGYTDPNPYLNMACELSTELDPKALHRGLLEIEYKAGRRSKTIESDYSARTIDIDILLYDDEIIRSADLIVPHPRIEIRRFVLLPLSEIAPQFRHPISGKKMIELLKETSDSSGITRYADEL
jgi:2-amino-4-hydroxy-6-hydroxymethyldihydropteridine diphosphokinase